MKYTLGIILFLITLKVFAIQSKVVKEPVSFSTFWEKAEELKVKHSCNFVKENNPYFEFMFVVLDLESNVQEDIETNSILSNYSRNLINEKLLAKSVVKGVFSEILCITDTSALVLNVLKTKTKADGYATGFASVVKYDYALENNIIKLKIHEGPSTYWYHMGAGIDVYTFYKIKFQQGIPTAK